MTTEQDVSLREYIDMRFNSRRETTEAQFKSIDLRLTDAASRLDEKLMDRDHAIAKAAEVMDERLDQMNRFRDQINAERASYVTLDRLELNLKGLHDQINILTRTMTLTSGKTQGASHVGTLVLNVLVGVSALMSGVSTFIIITQVFK